MDRKTMSLANVSYKNAAEVIIKAQLFIKENVNKGSLSMLDWSFW